MHVLQGEFLVIARRENTTPGIEDHHRLGTAFDLRVEIDCDGIRQFVQQTVHQVRTVKHHAFDPGKILGTAASTM